MDIINKILFESVLNEEYLGPNNNVKYEPGKGEAVISKEDVIKFANEIDSKYGYDGLIQIRGGGTEAKYQGSHWEDFIEMFPQFKDAKFNGKSYRLNSESKNTLNPINDGKTFSVESTLGIIKGLSLERSAGTSFRVRGEDYYDCPITIEGNQLKSILNLPKEATYGKASFFTYQKEPRVQVMISSKRDLTDEELSNIFTSEGDSDFSYQVNNDPPNRSYFSVDFICKESIKQRIISAAQEIVPGHKVNF